MDAEYWINLAKKHWSQPQGLLFALVAAALAGIAFSERLPTFWALLFSGAVALALIFFWVISRRLPRCPRRKLGFIVFFACDDSKIQKHFQSDFLNQLEMLLSSGPAGKVFWFKDLSNKNGVKITTAGDADSLRRKTRASFFLFGTVRSRGKGKSRKHYVDIKGMVWHGSIAEHNKKLLEREFSELLPARVEVPDSGTLPAFELTSQLAGIASEYILSVALECAGALNEAELLLNDLEPKVQGANVQRGLRIAQRIPTRRMEICIARARRLYSQWRESHNSELLADVDKFLDMVPESERGRPQWKVFKAILKVATGDDFDSAERILAGCEKGDPTIQLNHAFLRACRGDLRGATRHYRNAKPGLVDLILVGEVMDFIEWYRSRGSRLYAELTYCLLFISLEVLEDKDLSNKYLREFVGASKGAYSQEKYLVEKWMKHKGWMVHSAVHSGSGSVNLTGN